MTPPGPKLVDRGVDLHTHSDLTDGRDAPEAMADAALSAGLHTWGLSDHVRADSPWLPEYVERVRRITRIGLCVLVGVEVKILDADGRLDLPTALPELDYVLIADHQFPGPDGPQHPRAVRELVGMSVLSADDVVDILIDATCRAVQRCPAPAIVVHPFSLLPKMGLSEADLRDDHRDALAAVCRLADAAVEINEKWCCPSAAIAGNLIQAGVRLVAGSDAHCTEDVGQWAYLDHVEFQAGLTWESTPRPESTGLSR